MSSENLPEKKTIVERFQAGAGAISNDWSSPSPAPSESGVESATEVETPYRAFTPLSIEDKKAKYLLANNKNSKTKNLEDTVKRFTYLMSLTDLFSHFLENKQKKDAEFAKVLESVRSIASAKSTSNTIDHRHRKTEKEEDAELLLEEQSNGQTTIFDESPAFVNGELRYYQISGLNWLISLHENNISGILADEMGLGKTLQTISFLGYLRFIQGVCGPHLVIVPKSTLDNWSREFARWIPEINVFILQGDKEARQDQIKNKLLSCDFDVCITSYEIVIREKAQFNKFQWEYIIIDEAHRIKNEESMLSQIIRVFSSKNRLLITGTPLQNNLHELWALLNFILPDIFGDSDSFDEWFDTGKNPDSEEIVISEEEKKKNQDEIVKQLHKVLKPFLLRRIKSDVEKSLLPKKEVNIYTGMSNMQIKWYKKILEKDIDAVNGANGKKESKTRLLNIVMQLRKCCNHPYLFEGAEPGPPYTTDEHLVYNSGKMKILDRLLKTTRAKGSRVLIFSQMSRMLDILEDYCLFREFEYCRIDGQTDHEDRIKAIDEYNKPGSSKFVFLLTTRAGGLGINLTTADTVVLYDSDWNPQADLQAMDRAHRIGQTKQVVVYRFVTENAIEEKVIERATQKLRLDQLVIQQGRVSSNKSNKSKANSKGDLLNMIQYGASEIFETETSNNDTSKKTIDSNGNKMEEIKEDDIDIEAIVKKGEEKTAALNSRYSKLGLDDLQKFTSDSAYEWNGEDFKKKPNHGKIHNIWLNPSKRERKENYSVDMYYKDVLHTGGRTSSSKNLGPKAPKQIHIQDHQFYSLKLIELYEKEKLYYNKTVNYKVPISEKDKKSNKEVEKEQALIDNAEPLTEKEETLKKELIEQGGFNNWSRRDFTHFIQMCAKHGRSNYKDIALEFQLSESSNNGSGNGTKTKTIEDIKEYSKVFWQRYTEISGYDRYIQQIESGETKNRKLQHQQDILSKKISMYENPLQELIINYPPANSVRKYYSEEEDRYLLMCLDKIGIKEAEYNDINAYDIIRDRIRQSPLFQFDWFFLSRTSIELSRRCQTLLSCLVKEQESIELEKKKADKLKLKDKSKVKEKAKGKKKATSSPVKGKAGRRKSSIKKQTPSKKRSRIVETTSEESELDDVAMLINSEDSELSELEDIDEEPATKKRRVGRPAGSESNTPVNKETKKKGRRTSNRTKR